MPAPPHQDAQARRVTEIFDKLRGQRKSYQEIFAEVARELKQLARKMTAREPAGGSMHATRLLSDAYVKLFERPPTDFQWENGEDFFVAVARAMHDLKRDYFRKENGRWAGRRREGGLSR